MALVSTAITRSSLVPWLAVYWLAALSSSVTAATDTRLADAAAKRDTATVRALLVQGVDVNGTGRDGTPALHWLIRVDDVETAAALIRAGADPKLANRTA